MELLFCTTNPQKFKIAELTCQKSNIKIKQLEIEVAEVQSSDPKYILHNKAESIYKEVGKPLVVTDDSWNIPALNGFPGPYMKSVNQWLSESDWLALMADKVDKRIMLEQRLAYIDKSGIHVFEDVIEGKFLESIAAKDWHIKLQKVITLTEDGGYLSDVWQENPELIIKNRKLWPSFITWHKEHTS